MFLKQYSELRDRLLEHCTLKTVYDLASGAFEEISAAQVVVSVVSSIFMRLTGPTMLTTALRSFNDETVTSPGETKRKRAMSLAQEGIYRFSVDGLKVVPEWPLVYWWDQSLIKLYENNPLFGQVAPAAKGICTSDDDRFLVRPWETSFRPSTDINTRERSEEHNV